MSAPTVSGEGSGGVRGIHILGAHIFSEQGPAWSKSCPGGNSINLSCETYGEECDKAGDTGGRYEPVDGQPLDHRVVRRKQQRLQVRQRTRRINLYTPHVSLHVALV